MALQELHIITRSMGGSGTTFCALNLTLFHLDRNKRTLTIDLNNNNPDFSEIVSRMQQLRDGDFNGEGPVEFARVEGMAAYARYHWTENYNPHRVAEGLEGLFSQVLEFLDADPVREFDPEVIIIDTNLHIAAFWVDSLFGERNDSPFNQSRLYVWWLWHLNTLTSEHELDLIQKAVERIPSLGLGSFEETQSLIHVFNPFDLLPIRSRVVNIGAIERFIRAPWHEPVVLGYWTGRIARLVSKYKGKLLVNEANIVRSMASEMLDRGRRPRNIILIPNFGSLEGYTISFHLNPPRSMEELRRSFRPYYELFKMQLEWWERLVSGG